MLDRLPVQSPTGPAWNLKFSAFVVVFASISLVVALIVMPARDDKAFDPFAVICRALGISGYDKGTADANLVHASPPASDVAWNLTTEGLLEGASVTRGAVLARTVCGGCHGADGKSAAPDQFPNLAGQYAAVIFKELRDFRSGDRQSPFIQPIAQTLKDQQMADVAAYYAAQPHVGAPEATGSASAKIEYLVHDGDPHRAIPPCEACHGSDRSGPEGAPVLSGQSVAYLEQQLKSFFNHQRHNDVFERMRLIGGQLTAQEMHELAVYYHRLPTAAR
jgi:cytochrome c553